MQQALKRWLPRRRKRTHKGDYGRVLLIAGSRGMGGAAVLAARAVLRTGGGGVYVATPKSAQPLIAKTIPEAITIPLPETRQGTIQLTAVRVLRAWLNTVSAVAIGPGLTTHVSTSAFVRRVLPLVRTPVVIDADALNAYVGYQQQLAALTVPVVLTPHPGEFGRLAHMTTQRVQRDRSTYAKQQARRWGVTVVLKGYRTVIATSQRVYVNTSGHPGMATAGTGDVLTGMIASLLAQRVPTVPAARLGAYLHGCSGDMVARRQGEAGLIASDIVDTIPQAIRALQQ